MGILKFYGYEYEVSVFSYFKIAMSVRKDEDEIEEECFEAVKNIYKNDDIKVLDVKMQEFKSDKHFTFADVGLDLRIKVTEHTYERAYAEAEKLATPESTPVGVVFSFCEAYDCERDSQRVVGE